MIHFRIFKLTCGYRAIQKDENGDEVIHFCNHKLNPEDTEGNCRMNICPVWK